MTTEEIKQQAHKEFDELLMGKSFSEMIDYGALTKDFTQRGKSFLDSLIDKTVQHEQERIVESIKKMYGWKPCYCRYRKEECTCGDYLEMKILINSLFNNLTE